MINAKGFSFVEAIVTSLLLVIVWIAAYSLLQVNNIHVRQCTLGAKLQWEYETLLTQIATSARAATAVVQTTGDAWPPGVTTGTNASSITMKDSTGTVIDGFQVGTSNMIQEYTNVGGAWGWRSFTVGSYTVKSLGGTPFALAADRKSLTLSLSVVDQFTTLTDTAVSRGEVFQCRN